jgi:N,N'-diacetyllegionaminate synthase
VKFSKQDASRFDYWKRMEFSEDQWRGLKHHADERRLLFLSSPFSNEAVDLLERVGMTAWKVASGEIGNAVLLDRMLASKKPMLLSSGLSSFAELDAAVALIRTARVPFAVMQCTTMYPCPPEQIGIEMLATFRERYAAPVGLSDHSGTIYPGIAASALGCDVLEVHVALSREMFGPDVPASITTQELRQLVDGVRFVERMKPVDKDAMATSLEPLRKLFTKSVVARAALAAGTVLRADHLAMKKPGTGIPADRLPELVGRRLVRAVAADALLSEADFE